MAYLGYFLKRNSTAFSNNYLVKSSYAVNEAPIVINTYFDADYNKHVEYAPKTELTIELTLRQLYQAELTAALSFFGSDEEITLTYFNPADASYKTAVFTIMSPLKPQILRATSNYVIYNEVPIVLTRKRVVV